MNNNGKSLITKEGLEDLKKEFELLKKVKLPQVIERVSTARQEGDLGENAEYDSAKRDQEFLEMRLEEIENALKNSQIIDDSNIPAGIVAPGSTVVVDVEGDGEAEYSIVGSAEANPLKGKISVDSPVGIALIGKKLGDTVIVANGNLKISYRIKKIK